MNVSVALQLFKYGLIPIPLNGKRPIIKNWSQRFINSPLTVEEIESGIQVGDYTVTYNNKNIGILSGEISNIIVVDIDKEELLLKLQSMGELPRSWAVKTSRGYHIYFKYNKEVQSTKIWGGIDILSNKKIVVAPPSIHPTGVKYQWLQSPKDAELAELPTWLLDLIKKVDKKHSKTLYQSGEINNSQKFELEELSIDWLNYYSRYLQNIKGSGIWLNARCPFHSDRNNSFSFNIQNGGWICFAGCGRGNGLQFIRKIHDISFIDALDLLQGRDIYV